MHEVTTRSHPRNHCPVPNNPQHPQNYSTMLSNPQHSQNFISPSSSWPFVPFVDHGIPRNG